VRPGSSPMPFAVTGNSYRPFLECDYGTERAMYPRATRRVAFHMVTAAAPRHAAATSVVQSGDGQADRPIGRVSGLQSQRFYRPHPPGSEKAALAFARLFLRLPVQARPVRFRRGALKAEP
jgi:hypothetical protein